MPRPMPDLTDWLYTLSDDELRELISDVLPAIAAAAQAALGLGKRLQHGPGCPPGCCGAGVQQWR